uniref:AlNc14C8G1011 protein n=1 Tax=Albugo laibachii Nc14 TaxID=890382 RepID=F0W1T1_9STRA|nr:AlNc14C8G1011 [Albugo laibachii Nc14]|eukprot:CCA15010.1 AlNc14C8G1011 [Albugo laibachii Nc14]
MQRRKQPTTITPAMMKRVGGGYVLRKTPITPAEQMQPRSISEMARLRRKNEELSRLVSDLTVKLDDSAKEIVQLKETNDDLSCLLADTTKKHLEAVEYIDCANKTIQHLQDQLEASQSRNLQYEIEMEKAVKENEEGRQEFKEWITEHQQAKADMADMAETRSRLEALKAFMEMEGARYHQSDEKLLATDLVDNDIDTSKEELPYTLNDGYFLKERYMEECAYSYDSSTDECAYSQDSSTGLYAYSQCSSTVVCIYSLDHDEGAAALQDQVYTLNEIIDSLRRKVNVVENSLETCEFEKEILQMQLDRLSTKDT